MFVYDEFIKPILKGLNLKEPLRDVITPPPAGPLLDRAFLALLAVRNDINNHAANKEEALSYFKVFQEVVNIANKDLLVILPELLLKNDNVGIEWLEYVTSIINTRIAYIEAIVDEIVRVRAGEDVNKQVNEIMFYLADLIGLFNQIEGRID